MTMLKQQLTDDMKASLRAGDKPRLGVIRLMLAAVKQQEIDQRLELSDVDILALLDKMVKQRRESIRHYQSAGRDDLVQQEESEITIIQDYLPTPLTDVEIDKVIQEALLSSKAESLKDMGKVMSLLKPTLQGRADLGRVSGLIKAALSAEKG